MMKILTGLGFIATVNFLAGNQRRTKIVMAILIARVLRIPARGRGQAL